MIASIPVTPDQNVVVVAYTEVNKQEKCLVEHIATTSRDPFLGVNTILVLRTPGGKKITRKKGEVIQGGTVTIESVFSAFYAADQKDLFIGSQLSEVSLPLTA